MKNITILALIIAVSLMQGCATVTTGTTQTISVETQPPGASCKLTRGGENIGFVNPTPGSVSISKDKDNFTLECELDGHERTVKTINSNFQGMTLGNAILGGVIGLAVDAASGAMNEYPTSISLRLHPSEFPSQQVRDAYFDPLISEVKLKTEQLAAGKKYTCNGVDCKKRLAKLNQERDAELASLETTRQQVRIAGE